MSTEQPSQAVIYTRISYDPSGAGLGVARQEAECRRLAEALGLEVTRVYCDNDASATTGKRRPAFEEMLEGKPPVIITYAQDRLARHPRDMERLLDLGCTVHAIISSGVDLSTPPGRATARTLVAWALAEVETKGLRQRSAARQRAAQGRPWWSKKPFGFNRDGTLDPAEAPVIAEAYRMIVNGSTVGDIARYWASVGFTRTTGQAIEAREVHRILAAPRNAAIRTYKGQEVGPGAWEAIIDEPTYRAARAILKDPSRLPTRAMTHGRAPNSELSGLPFVLCGACDAKGVVNHIKKGGNRDWREGDGRFYRCAEYSHLTYPMEWVEGLVFRELVFALGGRPDLWSGSLDDGAAERLAVLQAEEISLDARSTELGEAFATGVISLSALQAGEASIRARLTEVREELATLGEGQSWTALDAVQDKEYLAGELVEMDRGEYRLMLGRVFERILLLPRGRGARTLDPTKVIFTTRPAPERSRA